MQTEIAQLVYFLYTLASLSKALYTSASTAATTCLGHPVLLLSRSESVHACSWPVRATLTAQRALHTDTFSWGASTSGPDCFIATLNQSLVPDRSFAWR